MLDHSLEIVVKLAYEAGDIKISIGPIGQCKVVSLRQYLDTMREDAALATDTLLKGGWGSTSDVDLTIK